MQPGHEYQIQTLGVCVKKGWMTGITRKFMDEQLLPCLHHTKSDDLNKGNEELMLKLEHGCVHNPQRYNCDLFMHCVDDMVGENFRKFLHLL